MRLLLLGLSVLGAGRPVEARHAVATARCSVSELRRSPGYQYRVERVGEFVDSATVIVRVVAEGADSLRFSRSPSAAQPESTVVVSAVRFRVVESLRGEVPGSRLTLPGRLVERDDYNPLPVPYTMVRRAGQHGDCWAREYRTGATYLLLLRERAGQLSPHWMPLAPLNEQLRDADDPWLAWVRARVGRATPPSGGV